MLNRILPILLVFFYTYTTVRSNSCDDPFNVKSIFVDPGNLCGICDDSNNGSISSPVCTVYQGLKILPSGGKLVLREGIHRQRQELDVWNYGPFTFSGPSADNKTEIRNFPGERAQIYLSANPTSWLLHSGSIYKTYWLDHVIKTNVRHKPQMVVINDDIDNPILLQQVNAAEQTQCSPSNLWSVRTGVSDMISGDFYYEIGTGMLYVWLPDSSDPNTHDIEVGLSRFFRFYTGLGNYTINGLEFRYSGSENVQCAWAMAMFVGDNIDIINNKFLYGDAVCLGGGGTNVLVKNNLISWCGNSGASLKGDSGIIYEDNEFSYHNWRKYSIGWHSGGMKLIPQKSNIIVRRNYLHHIWGSAIWFDGMGSNNTIENNVVFNNTRHGIFVEITSGERGLENIVRGNVVVGNFRGIYVSGSNYTIVEHNTLRRNNEQISFNGVPRPPGERVMFNAGVNNIAIDSDEVPVQQQWYSIGWHSQCYQGEFGDGNYFDSNAYDDRGMFSYGPGYYHNTLWGKWTKENGMDINGGARLKFGDYLIQEFGDVPTPRFRVEPSNLLY